MNHPSSRLAAFSLGLCVAACGPRDRAVELGFWLEPISFSSSGIGEPISADDLAIIETSARAEIVTAFQHLDATVTSNRRARYKVRVVQRLSDERVIRRLDVAGESRSMAGYGGAGAVSFEFAAQGAMVHAPEGATRSMIIEAIGRAAGRVAVHEFAHQLVPHVEIHNSRDVASYEYGSITREQYFGEMHWDIAGPALEERIGRKDSRLSGR